MSKSIGEALRLRPWRFVVSTWPWRTLLYALTSMVWALPLAFGDRALLLLPFLPLLGIGISAIERRRIRLLGYPAIPSGHAPVPESERKRWLLLRLGEAMTWRESGYALIAATIGMGSVMFFYAALSLLVVLLATPIAVAVYQPITVLGWTATTPWETSSRECSSPSLCSTSLP